MDWTRAVARAAVWSHVPGTGEVEVLAKRLQSDQTTLGKIMGDRELYDEFRFTIRELNLLIQDVKRNPRKYFKFSVF